MQHQHRQQQHDQQQQSASGFSMPHSARPVSAGSRRTAAAAAQTLAHAPRMRAGKRDFKERLERACELHGTSTERAKMPVKGCRKVTYVLDWGRVDVPGCVQNEKGEIKVIPNGFRVVFEASNYVWQAEICFQPQPHSQQEQEAAPSHDAPSVPLYEVRPVGSSGYAEGPGSGRMDNISAAFRRALTLFQEEGGASASAVKEAHRPNGRLYLGIFYPAVQDALKTVLGKEPHRVDAPLRHIIDDWMRDKPAEHVIAAAAQLAASTDFPAAAAAESSSSSSSKAGHDVPANDDIVKAEAAMTLGQLYSQHQQPPQQQQQQYYSHQSRSAQVPPASPALFSSSSSSSSSNHRDLRPATPVHEDMDLTSALLQTGWDDGIFSAVPSPAPSGVMLDMHVQQPLLPPATSLSRRPSIASHGSLGQHSLVFGSAPGSRNRSATATPEPFITGSSMFAHMGSWAPDSQSSPSSAPAPSTAHSAPAAPAPLAFVAQQPEVSSSGESRKRALADGGHMLLQMATSEKGLARQLSLEERLSGILEQIRDSSRRGSATSDSSGAQSAVLERAQRGSSDEDDGLDDELSNAEQTQRLLGMLAEIQKELVHRSEQKRRKTAATEPQSQHEQQQQQSMPPPQAQPQQRAPVPTRDLGELETLSHTEHDAIDRLSEEGRSMAGHSVADLFDNHAFDDVLDEHQAGVHRHHSSAQPQQQQDEPLQQRQTPIIVGCHMSHEGLYLRLAPAQAAGVSHEDLSHAITSLRIPAASSIVRAVLQHVAVDANGRVSMDDFLRFLREREQELKIMFDSVDTDGDGFVTLRDLRVARDRGHLCRTASDEELQALLEWMDTLENAYEDGKIHFEEFRTGMILLPPATTLSDVIKHFREKGQPGSRYNRSTSSNNRQAPELSA